VAQLARRCDDIGRSVAEFKNSRANESSLGRDWRGTESALADLRREVSELRRRVERLDSGR